MRQNVAHRGRECFEAFACTRYFWVDRAIENQVPFIKSLLGSGESNQVAAVLPEKLRKIFWLCRHGDDFRGCWLRRVFCAHSRYLAILLILIIYCIERLRRH